MYAHSADFDAGQGYIGVRKLFQGFAKTEIRVLSKEEGLQCLRALTADGVDTAVVASPSAIRRMNLKDILSPECRYITSFSSNPTVDELLECLAALDQTSVKRLICVGGGSAIDTGKTLCAVSGMKYGGPRDYEGLCRVIANKKYAGVEKNMDLIAVPTTAGTGADVTQWATVWDMRGKRKLSVDRPDLAPDLSLIIPAFTVDMPPRLTLSTGLDALAQAMEAFWAKARNALSQALALEAVTYIRKYLPLTLREPENVTYRGGMCMGALLSGLAFSKTRTTACHSISYPLTMYHGIPHGFAVAVTLEQVAERNRQAVPEIETLFSLFGSQEKFHQWLAEVSKDIQPLRLSAMGIGKQDLPELAKGAFTQGRMNNNPVPLQIEDVMSILTEIL